MEKNELGLNFSNETGQRWVSVLERKWVIQKITGSSGCPLSYLVFNSILPKPPSLSQVRSALRNDLFVLVFVILTVIVL